MRTRHFALLGFAVVAVACSSSDAGSTEGGDFAAAATTGAGGSSSTGGGSSTVGKGVGGSGQSAGSTGFGAGASAGTGTATGTGGSSLGSNGKGGGGGGVPTGAAGAAGGVSPSAGAGGGSSGAAGSSDAGAAGSGPSACAGLDMSPITLFQSSDDSNSMASPAIVRREILRGIPIQPAIVRPYEFLNYYRFDYQPAEPGHVRVVTELRKDDAGAFHVQVAIQSPLAEQPRRPMSLTFVLDTSGSMGSDGRIERERAVLAAIVAQLAEGDVVSLLSWSDDQTVMLDSYAVTGPDDPVLVAQVKALQTNGGTNLDAGLAKGYELATKNYVKEKMNRVLMISDGEANVGITNANTIGKASHAADDEGIYLVGVNVGAEAGDNLMNIVTDKGRGASVFIDTLDEANRMFGPRFDETMEIAARSVRLELTIPWYMKLQSFSGEQSSTNQLEVDPQHLSPNDAMVFNEIFAACSPDVVGTSDVIKARATWQTPLMHTDQADEASFTLADLLAAPAPHLAKGTAIFDYAHLLRQINAVPKSETKASIAKVMQEVKDANPGGDFDLDEIAMLLAKLDASL